MTWRQLFALRPQWWTDLAARVPRLTGPDSESSPPNDRAHFWEEFRAGQREADQRALAGRKLLPDENAAPK